MGRRFDPTKNTQHIIRIGGEEWKLINRFKRPDETVRHVVARLFYDIKSHQELISEIEQLRRTVAAMQRDLLAKETSLERFI